MGLNDGTKTLVGDVLGLTRQAVSKWGEDVPELYEYKLRVLRPHWFADPAAKKANGKARRG